MSYNYSYNNNLELDGYFFETDGSGNISIYNADTMKFLDFIDVSYRYANWDFENICKQWISSKNI